MKIITLITLLSTPLAAQDLHYTQQRESEMGRAAFASISEITSELLNDPNTNWSAVNMDALQAHLVDMNNVVLQTRSESEVDGEMIFLELRGNDDVVGSIERMMMAHAPMLATETGWDVKVEPISNGAQWQITPKDREDFDKILGLGAYGLLSVGAHHDAHHEMIARGENPHHSHGAGS